MRPVYDFENVYETVLQISLIQLLLQWTMEQTESSLGFHFMWFVEHMLMF